MRLRVNEWMTMNEWVDEWIRDIVQILWEPSLIHVYYNLKRRPTDRPTDRPTGQDIPHLLLLLLLLLLLQLFAALARVSTCYNWGLLLLLLLFFVWRGAKKKGWRHCIAMMMLNQPNTNNKVVLMSVAGKGRGKGRREKLLLSGECRPSTRLFSAVVVVFFFFFFYVHISIEMMATTTTTTMRIKRVWKRKEEEEKRISAPSDQRPHGEFIMRWFNRNCLHSR